ncbi:MAG: hypothetical protein K940chlam7_00437 [Chlamydiae bacterium]|nr:hypothetical protein [Chlamydiota bacterium]
MFKIRFTKEAEKQLLELKNTKSKQRQYKAVGKVIGYMHVNLRHPSLNTHKFDSLKSPFEGGVFESYAQNKTPGAYRIFWIYGPEKREITILAITPHP